MWNEKAYKRNFRWPQGVRLPIAVSVHHQSEEATCPMPDGQPDPFDYSERQYGARRGAWRLLEIMNRHGVRGDVLFAARHWRNIRKCRAWSSKPATVSQAIPTRTR